MNYKTIALIIRHLDEYMEGRRMTDQATINFLIDEFCYQLENDKDFNEKEFRNLIYGKTNQN